MHEKGKGAVDHDGTTSSQHGGGGALSQSGSDSEMVMYSSQAETTDTSADESVMRNQRKKRSSRVKDWESELWDLPGPMEVLALIYMGCLLKQEPVRVGDIYRWAKNNQLPFLGVVSWVFLWTS